MVDSLEIATTLAEVVNKSWPRFVSFYLWWVSRDIPAWAFFRLSPYRINHHLPIP
ncbi:hypothetical protein SAMN05192562_10686 [Kosakonia arachidis]|uniref:Uncharacterized protein n=1 Tax=Kosakonia arachidis TaxID=551989 RepID=A0A1I7DQM3_9ENTR|nr:hypothetical protein SAMN05192562_10686 [Kosakonia arachidis]